MSDVNVDSPGEATDYSHHDESVTNIRDMVYRGRTLLEKDRDDSSRFAAKVNSGKEPKDMSHKGITDFLRQ